MAEQEWAEQEWAKWIKLRPDMNLELGEFIVMSNYFQPN